jgi:hypothetical protein
MIEINLFNKKIIEDFLFEYPLVDPNSEYLKNKEILILGEIEDDILEEVKLKKANLIRLDSFNGDTIPYGAILAPVQGDDSCEGYYKIIDYYILNLQKIIKVMQREKSFHHIVVMLPQESNVPSVKLNMMAYYAIYGLVKGLGELYAPKGIFVNGLMPSKNISSIASEWLSFLLSNNSNNIVGEIVSL